MKIAELFVELGIGGTKKVTDALKSVKGGLSDIANSSLQTKAAVIGSIYALERMLSFSTNLGAGLKNFSVQTGISTRELQKWQYAGRKVNVTNGEIESSFRGVQATMGKMLMQGGAPEGMNLLEAETGFDPDRMGDTVYVMKKLSAFAKKYKGDISIRNAALTSFGLNMKTIGAMAQGIFTAKNMKGAQVFNSKDINVLAKTNATMAEFYNTLKMSFSKLIVPLIPQIEKALNIISEVIKGLVSGIESSDPKIQNIIDKITFWADKMMKVINAAARLMGMDMKTDWDFKDGDSSPEAQRKLSRFQAEDNRFSGMAGIANRMFQNKKDLAAALKYQMAPSLNRPEQKKETNNDVKLNVTFNGDNDNVPEIVKGFQKSLNDALLNTPIMERS